MFKTLILGLLFWGLTFLFPPITLTGFWTTIGVVVLFSIFSHVSTFVEVPIIIALTVVGNVIGFILGIFLSMVVSGLIMYLLSAIFTTFIIATGAFWSVFLFTLCYVAVKSIFFLNNN